jgi:hypothetical protein
MTWTLEKLETIPEVYRDFMMILKPVVDSRAKDIVMKFTGIPFGMVYDKFAARHGYGTEQIRQVAKALQLRGLIHEDEWSVFTPTEEGEQFIRALAGTRRPVRERVPPLPDL